MKSATWCVSVADELPPPGRPDMLLCLLEEEAEVRAATAVPVYAFKNMPSLAKWILKPLRAGRVVGSLSPTRFVVMWKNEFGTIDARRIDR